MDNKKLIFAFVILALIQLPIFALAIEKVDEFEDPTIFGLEVEKLLAFAGANLAIVLSLITFLAYYRTKKARLMFVAFAFLLFSAKLFLISSELLFDEAAWIDIASAILDFAILLSFFYGIIRK